MRGKKYKKLLTWLLCVCLMAGMIPNSAFAISVNAQQQEQTTAVTQETKEDQKKEEKLEQTQKTEQTKDSTKSEATTENTKETTTEQKSTTEEKKDEEKQENKAAKQTADQKKKVAVQSSTAEVTAVKLLEKEGTTDVWGTGIQTGSADLDDKSWDGTEETRGYDNSISNEIIRSFDTINYNVTSTINLKKGETHTLVYEITLPDDDELTLDQSKMNASDITCQKNSDGTKTYTCKYTLEKDYDGGSKTENIVLKVGNKHQGYVIEPTITSYLDEDKDKALTVGNMKKVTVTTAPMYNIVLKKHTSESHTRDIYEFNQGYSADGYTDNKVNGVKCTYGFALEVRKPGNGIKGVELPDPDKDFEFDIDLSNSTLAGKNMPDNGFLPLLYYVGPNTPGGAAVAEIPFTKESTLAGYEGRGCYNSGNVSMTQEGTTLHVKVKDFKIDESKFPSKNGKGDSYWQDANKILEGVFSAYQFQVVYPYINENGENLQDKMGDGSVIVKAVVKNMNATSETNTKATEETTLEDNSQSNTWELQSGNARNQAIFYSSRKENGIIDSYSTGKIRDDGDIAAVGANDLAFTVSYDDGKAGEAYGKEGLPVAIDQFVLFDSSAIKNVEFAQNIQQGVLPNKYGYGCTVRYAVHKGGHLNNETMREAKLEDFDFYDTKPEGVDVDGVLVQYRGMNLGPTNLKLHTQFNATVNSDYKTADNVYMVTAFTNVWTVSDFKDEILTATGKDSLDKVSMNEISAWGKAKDVKEATALVKDKDRNETNTIDNRDYYAVPEYKKGVYSPGSDHKFSQGSADGLYIVPYTTTVTKTVAQTDESGKPLQRYNVGKGQRYVDYRITSAMRYWGEVKPVEGDTTTVYLEDTIPKGLTYVSNSAYWGGSYTSKYPSAGVVRDGQQIEPASIVKKSDGSTVLKWEIPDVALTNGELPELHYSCEISKDVNDNQTLENTVTIQTDEDKRSIYKENDNISTAAITVTKDNEFYIVKRGGDHLELQDNSYYDLVAANTSSQDKKNLCIFDTMPYAGDGKSTQFNGQYKITGLTMNANDVNHAEDMEVWYTDDARYIGKTAQDIDPSEVTTANGWKKAEASGYDTDTITFTGDGLIGAWPTVIAYKDANLEKNTIATLRLNYEAAAGAENDDFVNYWTTIENEKELKSQAETDIYKRSIEGTVWYDKDKDGKIDKDETKLKDVKVTLLVKDKDGNYVEYKGYKETDKDGNTKQSSSVTYTDEDGHYKFDGLPTGDYRVKFESSTGADLGYYDVTTPNADTNKTVTSKVKKEDAEKDTDGKLTSGTIKDIEMPTLDKLVTDKNKHYNLPDQNLGLIVPTTDIFVMKAWDDAENQDGIRPTSIEVELYKNGKATGQTLTLTEDENWNGEFKDLPKYDDTDPQHLTENTYEVKEVSKVDGYTSQISPVTGKTENGYIITNTHTPSKINIPVQKNWNDADNQDGKRPGNVIVHLYANGTDTGKRLILTEAGQWKGTFEGLDEYYAGTKITYTVQEETVDGYTAAVTKDADHENGFIVTNTYSPEKTTVSGKKTWEDANNQDGKRPDQITVRLYANGTEIASKTVTAEDNWAYTFTGLDKYADGEEIVYTITEDAVPNYTSKVNGYNVTNSYTPGKVNVPVTKAWNDANDQDGKRPEEVTVHLYADGADTGKTLKLTADNQWSGSFGDLDEYKDGAKISYTVKEGEVTDYTGEVAGDAATGYVITNTHTPEVTEVSGTKTWDDANNQDGIRPDKITVNLLANGTKVASKEVTADDNWAYTFTGLDKYADGKEITYKVTEEPVAGYAPTYDDNGYNVTNTHTPEVTEVSGTKTWDDADNQDGIRPEKITVRLYADGTEVASKTVTAEDNWSYTFKDLEKYAKGQTGKEITYEVKEDKVEGYTTKVDGYNVTNSHTPEVIDVSGSKTWDDADNQDGKRPDQITIRLLANGEEVANKIVTADDDWSYTFTDLPKYENGTEINYAVTEDRVDDYSATVDGYNVTNSYTPGKISVPVTKTWKDKNNKYKARPKKITIHLYADGEDTGKTLVLNESNNWSGTFTDLDEYKNGNKIDYTVEEDTVKDYASTITGSAEEGYVVKNTYEPDSFGPPDGSDTTKDTEDKNSKSSSSSQTGKSARTGDTNAVLPWAIVCVASLGAIVIFRRKRTQK